MRRFLLLLVLILLALATVAEPLRPTATVEVAGPVLGPQTPIVVRAADRGRGLAALEVRLLAPDGSTAMLARQGYPLRSWLGSAVHEAELSLTVADATIAEGPATLEVWAQDHSWLPRLRPTPAATIDVRIDRTPPRLELVTGGATMQVGGSAVVVYRVGTDAAVSGVQVDDYFFPGHPHDGGLHATLFTVPPDAPQARPHVLVRDEAGNERTRPLDVRVRGRVFRERTLDIGDDFLARTVPSLLEENGLAQTGDLVAGYLTINRDLRARTEERLRALCQTSATPATWPDAFLRMPNAAPLSFFGDQRSYRYRDSIIDRQRHLGFDLASVRMAPVPAAGSGTVVHAGALGIYGGTVVLDHGLGLFTLYGHLSSIAVEVGATVARGEEVGRTGATGLAGGDHLHFSTMLAGVHVDPREWWDGRWIRDHVTAHLRPPEPASS